MQALARRYNLKSQHSVSDFKRYYMPRLRTPTVEQELLARVRNQTIILHDRLVEVLRSTYHDSSSIVDVRQSQ